MKTAMNSLYAAMSPHVLNAIATFKNLEALAFDLKDLYLYDPNKNSNDSKKVMLEDFLQLNLPKFTKLTSLVISNYKLSWIPGPLILNKTLQTIRLNFQWMTSSIISELALNKNSKKLRLSCFLWFEKMDKLDLFYQEVAKLQKNFPLAMFTFLNDELTEMSSELFRKLLSYC